jgi:hypothetical protein
MNEHQLAAAERAMNSERHPLPAEQPARFERRIVCLMNATGETRDWARHEAATLWPTEHAAFLAAKAPQ